MGSSKRACSCKAARRAVSNIILSLRNRSGLRGARDSIDEDLQEEIRELWVQIILSECKGRLKEAKKL